MTASLKHVLVPVDFGEASAAAVALAGTLAQGCGGRLTLLHAEALEAPVYFTNEQIEAMAGERRQRQAQAQTFLEAFGRQHTRTAFTALIEMRPAVEAIERHGASADLIVLGTHGRTGPRLWWLGSVTERVLRDITVPVLVVHAGDAPTLTSIAVHAAPGLKGDAAIALARKLGLAFGAEVHDHRAESMPPSGMFRDAGMVVVAEPRRHNRVWRTNVGEPLIRSGAGPVLFVPEDQSKESRQ
jgi:nucleotide-binding universal stress UspA family protein